MSLKKISADEAVKFVLEKAPPKAQWVFDCDGTLIRGDVGTVGAWGLLRSGFVDPTRIHKEWDRISLSTMTYTDFENLRFELTQTYGHEEIFEWESMLMAGLPPKKGYEIIHATHKEAFKVGTLLRLPVLTELFKKVAANAWVVSGSPSAAVHSALIELGSPRKQMIGTRLNEVDGILTAQYDSRGIVWAENKKKVLNELLLKPYFVAGDSVGDWNMMELSTGVCWCVLWPATKNPWNYLKKKCEETLGIEIPKERGYYLHTDSKGHHWVFEIHHDL